MKHLILLITLSILNNQVMAQQPIVDELKLLYDAQQYDKIINKYAEKSKDYSAKELYYIGLAYYMKENDEKSLKFMNASIEKDDKDPAAFFTKGSTLYYMGKHEDAIKCFKSAIALESNNANTYSSMGDAYYALKQ